MAYAKIPRTCQTCNSPFLADKPQRRFCKPNCFYQSLQKTSQDFWVKVKKSDDCWIWTGGTSKSAEGLYYGTATIFSRYDRAHRISWRLINGEIPTGMEVCHRCDNPLCVRPDHLFLGTHHENMIDMAVKGRSGPSRLTPDQVREMRAEFANGNVTYRILGERYGMTRSGIGKIITRKSWIHI